MSKGTMKVPSLQKAMEDIAGVKHSNPVELARHAAAREIDSESAAIDEVKPRHVRGLNPNSRRFERKQRAA